MTRQEWYDYGQKHCGIEEGDTVKVLRKAESKEEGWRIAWNPHMDGFVGQTLTVNLIQEGRGLQCASEYYWFPFFVLQLIEKAKPESALPDSISDIIADWDCGGDTKGFIKKLVVEILKQK